MDNSINFQGAFLIKQPSTKMWNNIKTVLPDTNCIVDFGLNSDKLIIMKKGEDKNVANFIIPRNILFQYFPMINYKKKSNPINVEAAKKVIDKQTAIISKATDLKNYFKDYVSNDWKPQNHIQQTLKVLNLIGENKYIKIKTKKGVTTIYNRNGEKIASASPNGLRGINFVYVYPKNKDASPQRLAVNKNGEIQYAYSREEFGQFNKCFTQNVNRVRFPQQNKANV